MFSPLIIYPSSFYRPYATNPREELFLTCSSQVEQVLLDISDLAHPSATSSDLFTDDSFCFIELAKNYKLSTDTSSLKSLKAVCEHNSKVCSKLGKFQLTEAWRIISLVMAESNSIEEEDAEFRAIVLASEAAAAGGGDVGAGGHKAEAKNEHGYEKTGERSRNTSSKGGSKVRSRAGTIDQEAGGRNDKMVNGVLAKRRSSQGAGSRG